MARLLKRNFFFFLRLFRDVFISLSSTLAGLFEKSESRLFCDRRDPLSTFLSDSLSSSYDCIERPKPELIL